jgi:carbamoyl-phosphate synthase large subunit
MITLLITGVGGPLGQALIKAARLSAVRCRVVGTDRTALSVGLDWRDSAHVIASSSDGEAYLADIGRVCLTEKATLILPGSDSELVLLAEHAAELRAATGAHVVVSSPRVLQVALDKANTAAFLEENGLRFPRFALLNDANNLDRLVRELGFPLIAKPCRGSGSRGLVKVQSAADVAYLRTRGEEMLLQEYLWPDDAEYTVAVYTQRDGKQAGSIALKRELVAGNTYRAVVEQNPALLAEAEAVVRALGASGPCNVQLRLTSRGPVTFEINPRFSGTTAMRAHFGFNEVEMAIRDFALQESVPAPAISGGVALRYWEEVYRPLAPTAARSAGTLRILRTHQSAEWMETLQRLVRHDFYFLPGYHALAEQRGEGEARLFVYEESGYLIALPLIVRPIAKLTELGPAAEDWYDATSVYGYAGPVASSTTLPSEVVGRFHEALENALSELRVVSLFSRLHPLLEQEHLVAGAGECRAGGKTISIDLTLPEEAQRAQYRGNVRSRIKQLRRSGFSCGDDREKRHLRDFISIYYETMRRVGAQEGYFFEQDYFLGLADQLGETLHLFISRAPDGEMLGGGLFTLCNGVVQYHLGGTRDASLKLSPTALMFDQVRIWANAQGARVLHLGGGVGASEDSLFQYKAGFSERRHAFSTWRWIIAPEVYARLADARRRWVEQSNFESTAADYFPAYRVAAHPRLTAPAHELPAAASCVAPPPVLSA